MKLADLVVALPYLFTCYFILILGSLITFVTGIIIGDNEIKFIGLGVLISLGLLIAICRCILIYCCGGEQDKL